MAASASAAGDIAFDQGIDAPPADFVWLDRAGRRGKSLGIRARFQTASLSRDGAHVAGAIADATGLGQLWIADLLRGTVERLTHGENDSYSPVWSPDGDRVAYVNRDSGTEDLYVQRPAGTRPAERVWVAREVDTFLSDWSADGSRLFFTARPRAGDRSQQVWMCDLERGTASALLQGRFNQGEARLSPDGHWLAYTTDESGRSEVFVRSFPDLERRWQVSTSGGSSPHWRADGREIVYESGAGRDRVEYAVAFVPGAAHPVGGPERLFMLPQDAIGVSPAADHGRFLALVRSSMPPEPPLRLLLGWKGGPHR
jgi:serine/threonine-protein kinase